ncbi:MAG: hypothetical protein D6820_13290, partial [Lentisphaerae bacterium]
MNNAQYVWIDSTGEGKNRYVLFRRNIILADLPIDASFQLFADHRYRLLVNGKTLGHGPARFKLKSPEYDTWDLLPHLKSGKNVIAVMVCAYGDKTFITDESIGGFIAWGKIHCRNGEEWDLATPGHWRALRSPAHSDDVEKMTFALGFPEVLDGRRFPAAWTEPDFPDDDWSVAV